MVSRKRKEWGLVAGGVALLLGACAPRVAVRDESAEAGLGVVRTLVEAFNRHEPAQMAALVHEDFEYLSVDGKTVSVDAVGREALKQSMTGYFASVRDVESVIEHATVTGPYVAIRERVSWTGKSGRRSQAALGVYEVREGLVKRVWYYPAVEQSKAAP
ncbi:nuclear transport factor 2 family protein [Archangium lansingense]|uniref:Nuclear transport factor 2 family protein n=1 Tax=Archangium lansingense TaxID=2995310 RepID=A0ABT4A581_9BACT|nr:nuclear transport factor 2 family protein [Archangium lansinium]MCY1076117.1 nuclear transport factor 2 family protein [Archangium lansinium]